MSVVIQGYTLYKLLFVLSTPSINLSQSGRARLNVAKSDGIALANKMKVI